MYVSNCNYACEKPDKLEAVGSPVQESSELTRPDASLGKGFGRAVGLDAFPAKPKEHTVEYGEC